MTLKRKGVRFLEERKLRHISKKPRAAGGSQQKKESVQISIDRDSNLGRNVAIENERKKDGK